MLAGKYGSHRHSTPSFSENVVVAETSYQMLGISSTEISELTFVVKKVQRSFPGCLFLENR